MEEQNMNEVMRALGRIEGEVIGIRDEQKRVASYAIETSMRVGKLERSESWAIGYAAGAGGLAGIIVMIAKELL